MDPCPTPPRRTPARLTQSARPDRITGARADYFAGSCGGCRSFPTRRVNAIIRLRRGGAGFRDADFSAESSVDEFFCNAGFITPGQRRICGQPRGEHAGYVHAELYAVGRLRVLSLACHRLKPSEQGERAAGEPSRLSSLSAQRGAAFEQVARYHSGGAVITQREGHHEHDHNQADARAVADDGRGGGAAQRDAQDHPAVGGRSVADRAVHQPRAATFAGAGGGAARADRREHLSGVRSGFRLVGGLGSTGTVVS
jgi:hypothetical protein